MGLSRICFHVVEGRVRCIVQLNSSCPITPLQMSVFREKLSIAGVMSINFKLAFRKLSYTRKIVGVANLKRSTLKDYVPMGRCSTMQTF